MLSVLVFILAVCLAPVGRARAQDVPRSERPQPHFARADWLSLNGPWELEFDPENVGLEQGWGSATRTFSRQVVVPFAPETQLSSIGDTGFHPWVWHRRTLTAPAAWTGRRVLLKFGAVDYRAMVWVNGQLAGRHEGGHTPFAFDLTEPATRSSPRNGDTHLFPVSTREDWPPIRAIGVQARTASSD